MTLEQLKNELVKKRQLITKIKVVTGSSRIGLLGEMADGTLKIGVKAKAEKGRANDELVGFIEQNLSPLKVRVKIISGKADRRKLVGVRIDP